MVKCGNGVFLLLSMIAMIVQEVVTTDTASPTAGNNEKLVNLEPFEGITDDLKANITHWNLDELNNTALEEYEYGRIGAVALFGLNNIREKNGVTPLKLYNAVPTKAKDVFETYLDASYQAAMDKETAKIIRFAEQETCSVKPSDFLIETIKLWYKDSQEKVLNTGLKKGNFSIFRPENKFVGVSLYKKTLQERKGPGTKDICFYACKMDFYFRDYEALIKTADEERLKTKNIMDGLLGLKKADVNQTNSSSQ